MNINIDRADLYEYKKPKKRTKERLRKLKELGMEEVGVAEFGFKGITSGLYIERIWRWSDAVFQDYLDWAIKIKQRHEAKQRKALPHQ